MNLTAQWPLFCAISPKSGHLEANYVTVVDDSIKLGNLQLVYTAHSVSEKFQVKDVHVVLGLTLGKGK